MTDRYAPRSFDGIVGQDENIRRIKARLDGANTPNFFFHGPPGTGKTATAYLIAEAIQGARSELLKFNSSDERGIDTVQDKIIPVVNTTTLSGAPMVIFLDEMDSMSKDAQQALRQPMQEGNAVFILACNEPDSVHDAVESRCRTFRFGELPDAAVRERVLVWAEMDDVTIPDHHLETIVSFANGDMRAAIDRYEEIVAGVEDEPDPTAQFDLSGETLESQARKYANSQGD